MVLARPYEFLLDLVDRHLILAALAGFADAKAKVFDIAPNRRDRRRNPRLLATPRGSDSVQAAGRHGA